MAVRVCDKPPKQISPNLIFTVYQRMAERKLWAPYMKDVDDYMASFQDLLDHATKTGGPVSSNAGETDENIFFHNANHIKHMLAAVDPFLERIPKTLQEQYLTESVAELFKLKTPSDLN